MNELNINDTLTRFADYINQQSGHGAAKKRKRRSGLEVELQPEPCVVSADPNCTNRCQS